MNRTVLIACSGILCLLAHHAEADVLCQAKKGPKKGVLTVRADQCKRSERLILDTATFAGAPGVDGIAGTDGVPCWDLNANGEGDAAEDLNKDSIVDSADCNGSLRIFGDGSAGELTLPAGTTNWASTPPTDLNTAFSSLSIPSGATLIVPSGTIIRSTGGFINEGTIVVAAGALGGRIDIDVVDISESRHPSHSPPGQGIALGVPGIGELSSTTGGAPSEGSGGEGVGSEFAASMVRPSMQGGGGGAGSLQGTLNAFGGAGGGALTILAAEAVTNTGTINADGVDGTDGRGSGAGGGGVVILASLTSISNAGSALISAQGGKGGNGGSQVGGGGGGGGGIIHLIAPSITTDPSNADVSGGAGGTATSITANPNAGGSGGGGSGGNGGSGGLGAVPVSTPPNGTGGSVGFYIVSERSPIGFY